MIQKISHPKVTLSLALVIVLLSIIDLNLFSSLRSYSTIPQPHISSHPNIPGDQPPYNFDYSWTDDYPYTAHAFGGILDQTRTNSYEAFLLNYQLGHRIFEVDFSLTEDDQTVAAHDANQWRNNATVHDSSDSLKSASNPSFTYDNFMSSLWYDRFHPVDLDLLFQLMQKYPDIYILTDTKFYDELNVKKQFTAFVKTAARYDSSLLDRFIIQIYKPKMLEQIMSIYPWKSVIYTLYANWDNWTPESIIEFSKQTGVKFITLWGNSITPELAQKWKSAGLYLGAHTVDNLTYANQLRTLGTNLIYTNYLLPNPK